MPEEHPFLSHLAAAVLQAADGDGDRVAAVAAEVWRRWAPIRDGAARGQEVRALVKMPDAEYYQLAAAAAAAAALGQPAVVKALTAYLCLLPAAIREAARRSAVAGAAKARIALARAEDLVPLLPPDMPRLPRAAPPPLPPTTVYREAPPPAGRTWCPVCAAATSPGERLCPTCRQMAESWPLLITGYDLLRELGRGGMGVVYLGQRTADGTVVAIKALKPAVTGSPSAIKRFLREASVLQELDHPHIVAFQDMGEVDGLLYFVMEYVRGSDAARLLQQQGPFSVPRAVALICQLLQALDYAHAKRFVHRDVKPANLLVTLDGDRESAKLADFGLARLYQASQLSGLTLSGDVGGTPAYMPPEQITDYRNVGPAADQYSAAASLYHLLTGRYIYDLPRGAELRMSMILQEEPVPIQERRSDIPAELAAVIHRALALEPDRRFLHVKAMRKALLPFLR
jgi:hypothetical protein